MRVVFPKIFQNKGALILTSVVGITFLTFSSVLDHRFVSWDDGPYVVFNEAIQTLNWDSIRFIFSHLVVNSYNPLVFLSFAVEYHFFGLNPFVFHLTNLLLHLAVTALVYVFARRLGLTEYMAGFGALLFGIHPMHVESVAWVSQRKDVLYSLFYMLALCRYLRFIQEQKSGDYLLTVLLGTLSVLAKPMAYSLPLILWLLDWFTRRKFSARVVLEKVPLIIIIGFVISFTFVANSGYFVQPFSGFRSLLLYFWTFSFYIQNFCWPVFFTPFTMTPAPISLTNTAYLMAAGIAGTSCYLLARNRQHRIFVFAAGYYLASIFLLLKYSDTNQLHHILVADRYMYLPSVGICLLAGVVVVRVFERAGQRNLVNEFLVLTCVALLVGGLIVKTQLQSLIWRDSFTFWGYVMETSPGHPLAYDVIGRIYFKRGKYELALEHFEKALSVDPTFSRAYAHRAMVYNKQGEYAKAKSDTVKSMSLGFDSAADEQRW